MKRILSEKGFSFVEIMVILVIIGLLLSIALPNYLDARTRAAADVCASNQKIIFTAATMYMLAESDSLEGMGDQEKLDALADEQYIKRKNWYECPSSSDNDFDDYEIIFENSIVADVECKEKPTDHIWPR